MMKFAQRSKIDRNTSLFKKRTLSKFQKAQRGQKAFVTFKIR